MHAQPYPACRSCFCKLLRARGGARCPPGWRGWAPRVSCVGAEALYARAAMMSQRFLTCGLSALALLVTACSASGDSPAAQPAAAGSGADAGTGENAEPDAAAAKGSDAGATATAVLPEGGSAAAGSGGSAAVSGMASDGNGAAGAAAGSGGSAAPPADPESLAYLSEPKD